MYIDVDKASRLGFLAKVRVRLNGKIIRYCTAAKHGRNGFVEYDSVPLRGDKDGNILRVKKRGNVKISFNL